jgi:hypothetical protein
MSNRRKIKSFYPNYLIKFPLLVDYWNRDRDWRMLGICQRLFKRSNGLVDPSGAEALDAFK